MEGKNMVKRFIEGKWLEDEEAIDFLVEEVYKLRVRLEELEKN